MVNPHDPSFVDFTFEEVEQQREYQLALDLALKVQRCFTFFATQPRYASLYDQLVRNSQGALLNLCEAWGRGRGNFAGAYWIARGEAFEAVAALSLCPAEVKDKLLTLAKELTVLLSERIRTTPDKPLAKGWERR